MMITTSRRFVLVPHQNYLRCRTQSQRLLLNYVCRFEHVKCSKSPTIMFSNTSFVCGYSRGFMLLNWYEIRNDARGCAWALFKFSAWTKSSPHLCRSKSPSVTNYSFSCGCERISCGLWWNFIPWVFDFEFARTSLSLRRKAKIVINFWLVLMDSWKLLHVVYDIKYYGWIHRLSGVGAAARCLFLW